MAQHGIHHVTAISGDARRNLDFYTNTLGLRLVKKTVNFDDPGAYHLYYGDADGSPGTILTFFPWAQAAPGRAGAGELQETMFRIPRAAIGDEEERIALATNEDVHISRHHSVRSAPRWGAAHGGPCGWGPRPRAWSERLRHHGVVSVGIPYSRCFAH